MKKIAMLNCDKANAVCTGASCMAAFLERKASFSVYKNQQAQLVAFMRCNGCDSEPTTDAGIVEKVERLKAIGTQIVHIGVCTVRPDTGRECPTISKIAEMIEERGIAVVRGTHAVR
ncbi:MAG: CGGC domain-containing protein [Fastidiosipilaceae bacterium]|jgi:predicted metal-binding protein